MNRFVKYKNNRRKRYIDYQKAIRRKKHSNLEAKAEREAKQRKNDEYGR